MNSRKTLLPLLCAMASILALTGCFGSSSVPPLPIAVSFSAQPPTSVNVGGNFAITAIVTNGRSNAMVNWGCAPAGACGSFTPATTATGVATTYMAPATVPTGGSVTISATSADDMTKSATTNVTVTPGGAIAVTFNAPAPPPTLTTGKVAQLSATITSTVANAVTDGVDWTATCVGATSGCGSFGSAHTNSGISTTYTAPLSVPAGGLAVTIKAASTLDSQDAVTGVINVTGTQTSAFLCAGCAYTFTFGGSDASGPYGVAGVFTADGMGNITGGEQDFSDFVFSTHNTPDPIQAGSTYQFGNDGRGTIILNTNDPNVGVNGVETLGVVFISANHLLITELDASASGSGAIDLQTVRSFSPSTLSGGYAFVFSGSDLTPFAQPLVFGGVFNVDSPGAISGTGSTSDATDGGNVAIQKGLSGNFTVSDAQGRIRLTLNSGVVGALNLSGPIVMNGYVTDAAHVKFVEADSNFGVTSGVAVGQGAARATLTSAAALPAGSNYVFATFGSGATGPIALATTFTSNGAGMFQNGSSDVNAAGVPSSGSVTGTYQVDAAGTGRVAVTLTGNVGNPGNTASYALYLTGGPDPAMSVELDGNAITTGAFYAQAAGPFTLASFQGAYGLNFTLFDPAATFEADVSGQAFADGAGNLLGTLDLNVFDMQTGIASPQTNQAFTGAYASAASGRFTGSINSTATGLLGVSYFVVSPSQVVFIETDSGNAISLGVFQLQTPPF